MNRTLDAIERRVLGALLEKSLCQPSYYPMTLNAMVAACNQKQNRDPVMQLDEPAVYDTLDALQRAGLITLILPGGTSRTKRFRHEAAQHYGWQIRERAVMTEFLLRGPQTVGELRSRCSRLVPFESLEAVSIVLECLRTNYDAPFVEPLPREPGRSAIRYTHLLYPEGEQPATAAAAAPLAANPSPSAAEETLHQEIESLRRELDELRGTVTALQQRVAAIDGRS